MRETMPHKYTPEIRTPAFRSILLIARQLRLPMLKVPCGSMINAPPVTVHQRRRCRLPIGKRFEISEECRYQQTDRNLFVP